MTEPVRYNIGCPLTIAIVNVVLMGVVTFMFAAGPYSSAGQEFWYRYGSLGFLLGGGILPLGVLMWGGRRYPVLVAVSTVWMLVVLLVWAGYILHAGGGM